MGYEYVSNTSIVPLSTIPCFFYLSYDEICVCFIIIIIISLASEKKEKKIFFTLPVILIFREFPRFLAHGWITGISPSLYGPREKSVWLEHSVTPECHLPCNNPTQVFLLLELCLCPSLGTQAVSDGGSWRPFPVTKLIFNIIISSCISRHCYLFFLFCTLQGALKCWTERSSILNRALFFDVQVLSC